MAPKKRLLPGNPLWIEWLQEWESEVDSTRSEYFAKAIQKARKSFMACPVPIAHPSGASTLEGVGKKTIQYLTERLERYCREHGLDMPVAEVETWQDKADKTIKSKTGTTNKKRKKMGDGDDDDDDKKDDDEPNDNPNNDVDTSPMKKDRPKKPYIPRAKSGPYAILVGLASYGTGAWETEQHIVDRADAFFKDDGDSLNDQDKSTGGAGHYGYSGWSSMNKTLCKKGLVEKKGRAPVLYRITYDGWKIARKAVQNAKAAPHFDEQARAALPVFANVASSDDDTDGNAHVEHDSPKRRTQSTTHSRASEQVNGTQRAAATVRPRQSDSNLAAPFFYFYLNIRHERVKQRDDADVSIDENDYTPQFLIEFPESQRNHVFTKLLSAITPFNNPGGRQGEQTFSALIPAARSFETAPGFDPPIAQREARPVPLNRPTDAKSPARKPAPSTSARPILPPETSSPSTKHEAARSGKPTKLPQPQVIDLDTDTENETDRPVAPVNRSLQAALARRAQTTGNGEQSIGATSSQQSASFRPVSTTVATAAYGYLNESTSPLSINPKDLVTFPAGSYDIVLLLDMREKAVTKGKELGKLLIKQGIVWESRVLATSDAIWIARCKTTARELVLDCCLERKRTDDLIDSLKDGRYSEQKNRMKKSGISRITYLIENYDLSKKENYYSAQIATIKSSLQVTDGFKVQVANSRKEVCQHLASMTHVLAEIYKYTTLYMLPDKALTQSNFLPTTERLRKDYPTKSFCPTFESHSRFNQKPHTLAAGWAKMVLSIQQMSPELTQRFVERFPTPAFFFSDLQRAIAADADQTSAERAAGKGKGTYGECWIMRQTLLAGEDQVSARSIGQALSTKAWKLFTDVTYQAS